MPRDKFIIKSSKKIKALHHMHKYCKHINSEDDRNELQAKIRFEIKMTLMILDQYIGADNIDKWRLPKKS